MTTAVESIKERLDIADVIGTYVKLDKAGGNFKARCPFHNERTPSFVVTPSRGTYYCFGCHAKGDMFTFIQEFEGLDFKGALKVLADRAGVELERTDPRSKEQNEKLFSILEHARVHFTSNLAASVDAQKYLAGRSVKEATVEEWSIGWAKDEWRALYAELKGKFTDDELEKSGLFKRKDAAVGGEKYYDAFRGRVMFPVFDSSGRTVGFSGRTLSKEKEVPKYINSPETPLFNKSELLYGLHKAKDDIRKKGYSILVEGQMDLIMCHQCGYGNTVAASGTALTKEHLGRLKKLSPRIIMAFDSDDAGIAAAERSAKLALGHGMEVKIAELPKGSDPADILVSNPKLWAGAIKNAKHAVDFQLDRVLASTKDPRKVALELRLKVLPFIQELPSKMEQSHYVKAAAKRAGIREEAVWEDLNALGQSGAGDERRAAVTKESGKSPIFSLEKRIMGIIHWKPELKEFKKKVIETCGEEKFASMMDETAEDSVALIYETERYYDGGDILEKEMKDLLLSLERKSIQEKLQKLKVDLGTDGADEKKLLSEIHDLTKKLDEVKKRQSG